MCSDFGPIYLQLKYRLNSLFCIWTLNLSIGSAAVLSAVYWSLYNYEMTLIFRILQQTFIYCSVTSVF